MKTPKTVVVSVAVAGLLFGGAAPAVAGGGHDDGKKDDKGYSKHDERKNSEVDVIVKYKKHGHWKTDRYEDKSLERAASIATHKCHGGDWKEYYKDARKVDRTGKSEKVCEKRYVTVYFEQDKDEDRNGHHGKK